MNLLAPVSEIMTKDVITIDIDDSFLEISKIFENRRIHHLPVLDEGKLAGIISKSDYLSYKRCGEVGEVVFNNNMKINIRDFKARHFMTRGLAKLEPGDRINIALEIFKENLFHAILVVEDGVLKGILSTYDIIFHLANDMEASQKYHFR